MEIFLSVLYLIIGLVLLIFGGDWFVKSSIQIARRTKIPQAIVGATIVSIATTLPELLVTILSSTKGSFGLAVGNSIGSVIINTGLVAGLALCFLTVSKVFMNPIPVPPSFAYVVHGFFPKLSNTSCLNSTPESYMYKL